MLEKQKIPPSPSTLFTSKSKVKKSFKNEEEFTTNHFFTVKRLKGGTEGKLCEKLIISVQSSLQGNVDMWNPATGPSRQKL